MTNDPTARQQEIAVHTVRRALLATGRTPAEAEQLLTEATQPPTPVDDQRLDEILARADATPAGPWRVYDDQQALKRWVTDPDDILDIDLGYLGNSNQAVAAFVAAARTDVPALVAEVQKLRTRVSELSDDVTGACLARYEEELDNARLRLALASAQRGRRELRDRVAELETFAYGCDGEGCVLPHSSWCAQAKQAAAENNGCTCAQSEHAGHCWLISPPRAEVDEMRKRIAELTAQAERVAAFCAQRAEYITSILNCHPNNAHDYNRWQGHAEARRQLAQALGLPVAWAAENATEVTAS